MEFTLRDAIYIGTYIVSISGIIFGLKFRISKNEASTQTLNKIVFKEKGGLNVVTTEVCKQHRDTIHKSIRQEAAITRKAFEQIRCLNQNIIKIMMHMQLEPTVLEFIDPPKDS